MVGAGDAWVSSPESMAGAAHRRLEELIVTLQLEPGSRWSEESLSNMIEVGRTPVREAVKRLQSDHLIKILPRHGLMIAEINLQEQLLVIELRRELELLVSIRAARRSLGPERLELGKKADLIEQVCRDGDLAGYLREVSNISLFIAKIARNPFAERSISPLVALSRRFYFKYFSEIITLREGGALHAARARAVAAADEEATMTTTTALMDQVEAYTRRIFMRSFGSTMVMFGDLPTKSK